MVGRQHVASRTIDEIASALVAELEGSSDEEARGPVRFWGHSYGVLIGPHSDDGLCWCQPRMVRCPHGNDGHTHPVHEERSC